MDWWTTFAAWALLAGLDHQRAQAFAAADPTALAAVYVDPSADAASIRAYADRGGRVVGLHAVVERLAVVRSDESTVVIDLVDRVGPARVEWDDGSSTQLPRDRSTRCQVVLRLTDEGWRIAESAVRLP